MAAHVNASVVAIAGIAGLPIGSFLTVVVHRVPAGESIVAPGSRCPACGTAIRAVDNSAMPQAQARGSVFASDVTPSLAISAGGPPAGAGHNVEVIQGDQRTEVHFP